jgi:transposase-like protein
MDTTTFFTKYSDEESCKEFFKQKREDQGLSCLSCGSIHLKWIANESRWRCKECKQPMGLKQGTVMENSNLSYRVWLLALYYMTLTKKGFSALEMQRLVGHKRYEPIWLMMQKIRISMGRRDNKYPLDGFIEMDEGFFEGHRKKEEEESEGVSGKPVKELDRQVKAIVAVSTSLVADKDKNEYRPGSKAGFLKMSVVSRLSKVEVSYEAAKMVQKSAVVITDGRRCYTGLKDICAAHEAIVIKDKKEVSKVFPWVHTAISNAKKKFLGLHHQVKNEYMQNYLNEFCYKFNRRYFGQKLFERLIVAALEKPWYSINPNNG